MKKILFLFVMSAALLTSCSKDDKPADNEQFDGSMDSVSNFLGEELLAALVDLGFNVNAGNRPPSVEGHFEISPCVLESSNVPGDWPGYTFDDYRIKFSNQDGLKVDYDGKHVNVSQSDVGDGSFISGDGNKFTVYLITATESDTYRADTAIVISGKIENDGIHDIQLGFFMKDNYGNPGGNFIGNNEGRIIVDGDGLAEKISGNKPAPVQNSLSSDERISIGTRQK